MQEEAAKKEQLAKSQLAKMAAERDEIQKWNALHKEELELEKAEKAKREAELQQVVAEREAARQAE